MSIKSWLPIAYLAALAVTPIPSQAADWTASWGAAPLAPSPATGPFAATPTFSNQTIRQIVRITAGGTRIRIRFTNEYGSKPLLIGAARVALADANGAMRPEELVQTVGRKLRITLPEGIVGSAL